MSTHTRKDSNLLLWLLPLLWLALQWFLLVLTLVATLLASSHSLCGHTLGAQAL